MFCYYDQLVHFDKEINANVFLLTVLRGHPVLSGHYSIPLECPLNTGFTVVTNVPANSAALLQFIQCVTLL